MRFHNNNEAYFVSASVAKAIVTGSFASDPVFLGHVSKVALTVTTSGTLYGTGSLEGCNDKGPNKLVNWVTITQPVTTVQKFTNEPATGVTPLMYTLDNTAYEWLRFKFVPSSQVGNSGSLNGMMTIKGTI